MSEPITTGILLFDDAEELDFVGPWEVLTTARKDDDERWVMDGNLVTAAGVSAGIDMALWLTGQLYGERHAREVQRFMEYDPAPPFSYTR